jgi:hypothetical protein
LIFGVQNVPCVEVGSHFPLGYFWVVPQVIAGLDSAFSKLSLLAVSQILALVEETGEQEQDALFGVLAQERQRLFDILLKWCHFVLR